MKKEVKKERWGKPSHILQIIYVRLYRARIWFKLTVLKGAFSVKLTVLKGAFSVWF
jgi:hypothetical protein